MIELTVSANPADAKMKRRIEIKGARIEAIEVNHWGARRLTDRHRGYGGFLITKRDRALVFGGDDVTFVCDGRLGLSLATLYAREFAAETAKRPECGPLTARAGIAIVKTHYPFARAYALADGPPELRGRG